ncbi:MAG: hypothetical protein AAB853_00800, partial [Patescibacteria group bacterium]
MEKVEDEATGEEVFVPRVIEEDVSRQINLPANETVLDEAGPSAPQGDTGEPSAPGSSLPEGSGQGLSGEAPAKSDEGVSLMPVFSGAPLQVMHDEGEEDRHEQQPNRNLALSDNRIKIHGSPAIVQSSPVHQKYDDQCESDRDCGERKSNVANGENFSEIHRRYSSIHSQTKERTQNTIPMNTRLVNKTISLHPITAPARAAAANSVQRAESTRSSGIVKRMAGDRIAFFSFLQATKAHASSVAPEQNSGAMEDRQESGVSPFVSAQGDTSISSTHYSLPTTHVEQRQWQIA